MSMIFSSSSLDEVRACYRLLQQWLCVGSAAVPSVGNQGNSSSWELPPGHPSICACPECIAGKQHKPSYNNKK